MRLWDLSATGARFVFDGTPAPDEIDVLSATLDLNNNLITNIGSAGTDFTSGGGLTLAGNANLTLSSGTGSLVMTNAVTNVSEQVIDIAPGFTGGGSDGLNYNVIDIAAFAPSNASGTDYVDGISIGNLTDPGGTIESTAIDIGTGWDYALRVAGTTVVDGSGNIPSGLLTGTLFDLDADSGTLQNVEQGDEVDHRWRDKYLNRGRRDGYGYREPRPLDYLDRGCGSQWWRYHYKC